MSILTSVEHVFAAAITDARKAAKVIQQTILPALQTVHADASTIEAISGLIDPRLVNVERAADAVLGLVIKAITDAGSAQAAGGVNITLDAALVADIKSIIPMVQQLAGSNMALVPPKAV
jgi:hypothetical protein